MAVVVVASVIYALIDETMPTRRNGAEAIVTAGRVAGDTLHAPELWTCGRQLARNASSALSVRVVE